MMLGGALRTHVLRVSLGLQLLPPARNPSKVRQLMGEGTKQAWFPKDLAKRGEWQLLTCPRCPVLNG